VTVNKRPLGDKSRKFFSRNQYFIQAKSRRGRRVGVETARHRLVGWRVPHGQAEMPEVAQRLGMSQRTLARRLESEKLTFLEVLDSLRFDLAKRYLREPDIPIAEVAWLLGYRERC
jgi:AraC-like DNA-binding protein